MTDQLKQAITQVQKDIQEVVNKPNDKELYSKVFDELKQDLQQFQGKDAEQIMSAAVNKLVKAGQIPALSLTGFNTQNDKVIVDVDKEQIQIEDPSSTQSITFTRGGIASTVTIQKLAETVAQRGGTTPADVRQSVLDASTNQQPVQFENMQIDLRQK